jgi:hypothetical protein
MKKLLTSISLALFLGILTFGVTSSNAQGRRNQTRIERDNRNRTVIVQQRNNPNSQKWYKSNNGRKVKRGYYNVRPYVGNRASSPRLVRVYRNGRYYWVRRY